jgi:predicted dehydrogenase
MSQKIYNIGIIGMGKMGEIRKSEIDLHSNMEVVAVTDIDLSVKQKYPELYKDNWQEVLNTGIDAVFVCTFNDVIAEIVCLALERGLHVFSEKPPGKTVKCIEKMKQAESNAIDKILKFGFNHRYHHSVMKAKKIIDCGDLGRILWARGSYGKSADPEFESVWRSDKDQAGGGILLDQGIHMADLLIHFMGEFVEVKSMVETQYWNIPMEDNAHALLKSKDGAVAMLHSSATHWKNYFSLEIGLERGIVHLDGILSNSMSYAPEKLIVHKKMNNLSSGKKGFPTYEEESFSDDDSWKLEVQDFFYAISNNKKPKHGNSKDAMLVMKLISEIYKSAN